jgi:leader peptidase (prepilin peptidase) / N-methyltransferase
VYDVKYIAFAGALFFILGVVSFVDAKKGIIPNSANVLLAALALIWTFVFKEQSWVLMLSGALLGGGMLWGLRLIHKRTHGIYGLGFGDVKLMATGGALLGPTYASYAIALGAAVSLLWVIFFKQNKPQPAPEKIAFGPGLSIGIACLWAYQVWRIYYGQ